MATMVKCGEVYTADFAKSGEKDGKVWEMLKVNDVGKGRRDITIWVNNAPSGVQKGSRFTIEKIESTKWGARKGKDDSWRDEVSINADVKSMEDVMSAFSDLDDDDGELPF